MKKINIYLLLSGIFLMLGSGMTAISLISYLRPVVWIEWSTASELNTAGYFIYRSEGIDKPFVLINKKIIPGSPDPLRGGNYQYKDCQVKAGGTYLYRLDEVENNGTVNQVAQIQVYVKKQGFLEAIFAIISFGFFGWSFYKLKKK